MNKGLLFFFLLFIPCRIFTQTLNLPVRQSTDRSGSQFVSYITSMNLTARENAIYAEVLNGNVPSFMRNLIPVSSSATVNGTLYTVIYYVIPDYTAIGCDSDYFLCPMTPLLAQRVADQIGYTLPTRKMVNDIWTTATVKLEPSTIAPSAQMTTVPIFYQHDTTVWKQRSAVLSAHPLGELVGGDKKDVIISNHIYGNPSPGRVVIYGWHHTNGTPIQPLYYGHENTYADYSHGIRLVQLACTLNGIATTINDILASSTLNTVLSDEGSIAVPRYPVNVPQAITPHSFCALRENANSIRVIVSSDSTNYGFAVQLSNDGLTFGNNNYFTDTNFVITNLLSDSIYFMRIAGYNGFDTSAWSEVLAATPSAYHERVLIVNGFDRAITGNTYNFVRQHGTAIYKSGYLFSSATNDAVINGLVSLSDFSIVDYILGEESTADETFSSAEQILVSSFLDKDGKLFVSGSEIAWDLDNKGSASDKNFYHNYFKAQYVNDAPNGQSSTYYNVSATTSQFFGTLPAFGFDNGTHGTYNVAYPDAITGVNGGSNCFFYTGFPSNYAGICYTGVFPSSGTAKGKLVNLGFPFETVYPDTSRNKLMSKIIEYFEPSPDSTVIASGPLTFCENDSVTLTAFNDFGYTYQWIRNGNNIANANAYFYTIHQGGNYSVKVTHNGNSFLSSAMIINVNSLPAAFAGHDTAICSGGSITLTASGGTSYSWNNGVVQGIPFTPVSTQTYVVTVTAANTCSATDAITVNVNQNPATPVISQNGNILSSSYAYSYQWYDSSGAISGGTFQHLSPAHDGTYSVVIIDSVGCSAQSQSFHYVATSIVSFSNENNISFYYDSNSEVLHITNTSRSSYDLSLKLLDANGKTILLRNISLSSKQSNSQDIQGLAPGIYFIQIQNDHFVLPGKLFIK